MSSAIQPRAATMPFRAEPLPHRVRGALIAPSDARYDEARRAFNLSIDQRPAAVAIPEDARDVAEVVMWARARGLRVAPQGTGHGAGPLAAHASLDDVVLLKTSRLADITIDANARLARVGAGARWGAVVEVAGRHGLAALAGSSPTVGVAGYTLGGGLGWLARTHGLACNSVVAIELVTADGELLRVDATHHAELFWALRGGGGSFGIVTALEFHLYEVPSVYAGTIFWPGEKAAEVMHAYRAWTGTVPNGMTSLARLINFPSFPHIAEPLRGRRVVAIEACWLGAPAEGEWLMAPFRAIPGAMIDTVATMSASQLERVHNDPPSPAPFAGDHVLLDALTPAAVDAILEVSGPDRESPLISLEVRHLGGALGEVHDGHGALAGFDASYAVFFVGAVTGPDARPRIHAHCDRLRNELSEWRAPLSYTNFADRGPAAASSFTPPVYARLMAVKRAWDPAALLVANHSVG